MEDYPGKGSPMLNAPSQIISGNLFRPWGLVLCWKDNTYIRKDNFNKHFYWLCGIKINKLLKDIFSKKTKTKKSYISCF